MDRTSIDLRSISCKGIKSFNLFQKPSLSAAVSVAGQKKRTAADPDGGRNPEWAESFRFDVDPDRLPDLRLRIDVVAQGNLLLLLPDRVVGRVDVPVADLLKEGADGSVRHVSYRVEGTDGRPNGVIRFSFNVNREAATLPVGAGGYRPPLPHQLDPLVSPPAGDFLCPPPRPAPRPYPPPRQQDPAISSAAAAVDYYPPPRQQDPAMPLTVSDHYPVPRQLYQVTSSTAATDLYPPPRQQDPATQFGDRHPPPRQRYPVSSSTATECYPPPRRQDPLISSAAAGHCPPPRQHDPVIPSRATDFYPPPRQHDPAIPSTVDHHSSSASQLYPAPRQQEPVTCYPPRAEELCYFFRTAPAEHGAYPAPSAPPEPASCYPPPQAAYCYPAPDAYRSESWDRRLY